MKTITLHVTEEVHYEEKFRVKDNFDVNDEDAVEELWCSLEEEPRLAGVIERSIEVTQ